MAGKGIKLEWNDEIEKGFNEKFEEMDTDKDGKLTFDQVREHVAAQLLRRMRQNPTDSEIKEFMAGIDKDGDGAVSKDELRTWIKQLFDILQDPKKSLPYAIDIMFRACDADKNGKISKTEISNFMREKGCPIKDSEIDQVFAIVDSDGDTSTLTKEVYKSVADWEGDETKTTTTLMAPAGFFKVLNRFNVL